MSIISNFIAVIFHFVTELFRFLFINTRPRITKQRALRDSFESIFCIYYFRGFALAGFV